MPVASPTRFSTSSSITGSYRSTLSSSTSLDKPYYRSSSGSYVSSTLRSSYGDRTTEYRSRYSDIDGKKERKSSLVEYGRNSRAPSVTDSDSGLRYRSDRSESRSRDISTTRSESGKTTSEPLSRNKRSFVTSAALAMSTAELYDKYSPNNYIPLTQRLQQASSNYGEISRSKSISNDIGRPPSDPKSFRKARNSAATISERPESRRYKELSPSTYTKRSNGLKESNGKDSNGAKDSNGNEVPSVSEIRKRFDPHMTVTKLPANETRYHKHVETYLSQLKDSDNGIGYTKVRDDKIVPVHLPYVDKKYDVPNQNGKSDLYSKYDLHNGRSHSNTELSQITDKNHVEKMSTSLNSKIPSDRLASIKSQLDPNNPIGKILEKSTVIQVQNDDFKKYNSDSKFDYDKSDSKYPDSNSKYQDSKLDADKKARHTSNFASYIQMSQPIASGVSPKKTDTNDEKADKTRKSLKYIDSENEKSSENEIESPSGTGFENKTFEHQNFLKMRVEKEKNGDVKEAVSMETSTESTLSEATEELSPDTPTGRRRISDSSEERTELAGGKSGPSGLRRSSERSDSLTEGRTERSSQTSGLNGLRNIGNTCFMNSVVQCLSNTRPLLEYLSGDKYVSEINTTLSCMRGALIGAFAHVIKELWRSGERECVVNTSSFKSQVQRFAPRFMGYNQQDAQEFLRYLLEGLHEDVNRITVKPKPILTEIDDNLTDSAKAAEAWSRYLRMEESRVGDIFVGQLKSTLRCTHCRHDSVTFDPFWDLSLPIPSRTGNLKIQQCLQHFTKEEELDGDEKPTCSKCGVRRKCLKWFTVQKFPQVLVLHLKRFSPTERFRGKLNVLVEFPLNNLEMGPYAASKGTQAIYNLYAVSNHSGTTYSGHYTAYCKHPYTGEWHEYNDSRVSPIKGRDVVSSEAYVLFYELAKST